MRVIALDLFAIATMAIIYGASVANAAVAPGDFAGRWLAKQHNLTLDVSRCGNGWCGVVVTNGSSCGRTALRLDAGDQRPDQVQFKGRLQLAAETEPYGIMATLHRRDDALTLTMSGHSGGTFEMARRTFDFHDMFARTGEPVCRPDPKIT